MAMPEYEVSQEIHRFEFESGDSPGDTWRLRKHLDGGFVRYADHLTQDPGKLREWLTSEEGIELLADHMSPYVGEALAGIRREAPHVRDLYRERAKGFLAALAEHFSCGEGE